MAGQFNPQCDTVANPKLDAFIGSDDPPLQTVADPQLQNANTASGGVNEVTVPVFQAPVGLLLSLPGDATGYVKLGNGTNIGLTNALVREIYDESIPANGGFPANSWGALLTLAGLTQYGGAGNPPANQFKDTSTDGAISTTVVREVRAGGSGTTYSLQGFLSLSQDATYSGFSDDEALWPGGGDGSTTDGCPVGGNASPFCPAIDPYANGFDAQTGAAGSGNSSGGNLVKNTEGDPGTFGYANLADITTSAAGAAGSVVNIVPTTTTLDSSATHTLIIAKVQNNYDGPSGVNTATFAKPGAIGGSFSASTVTTTANIPTAAANTSGSYQIANAPGNGTGDWQIASSLYGQTYGGTVPGDPNVANHGPQGTLTACTLASVDGCYPISAATYDIGWQNYEQDNLATATYGVPGTTPGKVENTVAGYFAYELGAGASDLVAGAAGYQKLPSNIVANAALDWEAIAVDPAA
jgi:hypothetical protein